MKDTRVYTAPWVVPISSDAIRYGAIVVNDTQIIAVGTERKIRKEYPEYTVIECHGILTPPLINCHIHLELSYLAKQKRPAADSTMVDWVEDILHKRQDSPGIESIGLAMDTAAKEQFRDGVILLADISNTLVRPVKSRRDVPEIYSFLELLGPTRKRTEAALQSLSDLSNSQFVTAHSPYSTSARLIVSLKKRASLLGHIFSLHVGESSQEIELVCQQTGGFRQFLEKRGSWEPDMLKDGIFNGSVDYLNSLGVLDNSTLCVHCVHITENEIQLLAEKEAGICLCPGSNEFLGIGVAPLERILRHNILPALGTDSRASNDTLDMWREMQILRRNHPTVSAESIFSMATLGGARALHRTHDYGTLEQGRKPVFIEAVFGVLDTTSTQDIYDILTSEKPRKITWRGSTSC